MINILHIYIVLLLYQRYSLSMIQDYRIWPLKVILLSILMLELLQDQELNEVSLWIFFIIFSSFLKIYILINYLINTIDPDQYTAIPLPVKIVKLLIADLGNCLPNTLPQEDAESIGDEVSYLYIYHHHYNSHF